MTQSGVLLEGSFERSFMFHAVSEGLTPFANGAEASTTRQILKDLGRSHKRNEALFFSLLFNKVHLYEYWSAFDLSRLLDEDLVATIEPTDPATYYQERGRRSLDPYIDECDVPTLRMLRPVVLPYLRRNSRFVNAARYERMLNLLAAPQFRLATYEDRFPHDLVQELDSISPPENHPQRLSATVVQMLVLYDDLIRCLHLLKESSRLSIPVASPLLGTPLKRAAGSPRGSAHTHLADRYYRVYQVLLEEIEYFPVITSLKDVIRLRRDPRLAAFREHLFYWAQVIQAGESAEEAKIRSELRKANLALRRVGTWKRIAGLLTYLALPVLAVPNLSVPLALLGAASQAYIDTVEWKNRWLLFGR